MVREGTFLPEWLTTRLSWITQKKSPLISWSWGFKIGTGPVGLSRLVLCLIIFIPTDLFTIIKPQNRLLTDFEAQKLWKGQSGFRDENPTAGTWTHVPISPRSALSRSSLKVKLLLNLASLKKVGLYFFQNRTFFTFFPTFLAPRSNIWQFNILIILCSTFLNNVELVDCQISWLWNCETFSQVSPISGGGKKGIFIFSFFGGTLNCKNVHTLANIIRAI